MILTLTVLFAASLAGAAPGTEPHPTLEVSVFSGPDFGMKPLPGATVTLVPTSETSGASRRLQAQTNARGSAILPGVPPGRYEILCTLGGFLPTRVGPVSIWPSAVPFKAAAILNLEWKLPHEGMRFPAP